METRKNLLLVLGEWWEARRASTPNEVSTPPRRALTWLGRQLLPNLGSVLLVLILLSVFPGLAAPFNSINATSISTIPYQGRLADASGNPVTGKQNMEFRIYNAPVDGTPLWEEFWTGANSVDVSDGLFSVMLGSINTGLTAVVQGNTTLYLGITVGTDSEMAPRVQLGSVPFSIWSLTVADNSITTAKIADNAVGSSEIAANAVGSSEIAAGAVTQEKMGFGLFHLLGQKTCADCGNSTESSSSSTFVPVKGNTTQDKIEVTVTKGEGPVMVHMTARYQTSPAAAQWCAIVVYQGQNIVRIMHLDGDGNSPRDWGCSGTWLFTDLPAGTFTFQAAAWATPNTTITWLFQRQIAVYGF